MADLREARSKLRRWCYVFPTSTCHFSVAETTCLVCYQRGSEPHRGRIRRTLVCSVCEQGYFTRWEFDDHECHDAD